MSLHPVHPESSRGAVALTAALLTLLCAACDPPPVFATADERQHQEVARIEGEVVITGQARGDVVLTLFAAERPPPPEGTGRPLSFAFIPEEEVFGSADPASSGPFTAPYAFDLVGEGKYLIKGFVDRDGCVPNLGCRKPDFLPWYGVTGEPNGGDMGGAAVDAATRAIRVVEVARDEDGKLRPATHVAVSFAESATIPADRPVFSVQGTAQLELSKPVSFFQLTSQPIDEGVVHQPAPVFFLKFVDDDHDGVPDDANGDGVPEFWPKVVVRKLADKVPPLRDENDLDNNGVLDEGGLDYEHLDGTKDGKPDLVVLAAGLRPDTALAQLMNQDGTPKMTPVPVNALDLVVRPIALDARDPKAPVPLKAVPAGRYAVVLIQFTGQTWRVPNELQPGVAKHTGLPSVESQAFFIEVK